MENPAYGLEFRKARRAKELTQVAVAKSLGVSQSYIAQIEAGRSFPSPALASQISRLLGLRLPTEEEQHFDKLRLGDFAEGLSSFDSISIRLPIIGLPVPGDEERTIVDGEPHGSIPAPPQLASVPGARALYVRGRSMEPRYYAGELVYINPAKSPNPGDFVLVLVREPQFATPIGYVRQYLGGNSDAVRLATLNPWREAVFDRETLISLATIVGSGLL